MKFGNVAPAKVLVALVLKILPWLRFWRYGMDFENVVLAMVLEVPILKNTYFPNEILILILKMLPWLRFWRY